MDTSHAGWVYAIPPSFPSRSPNPLQLHVPSIPCPLSLYPSSRDAACLSWGQQPACSTPGHLWQRCLAGVICLLHSAPCDPLCLLMIRADSLVYHLFPYCSHSCSFFSFHFLSHFCLPCPCFHLCHLFLQLPSRAAPM